MRIGLFLFLLAIGVLAVYAASKPKIWGPFVYPLPYRETIKDASKEHSLDPNLVAAVIYEESRFNAGQQSRAGAQGLMQLLPATAASIANQLGETRLAENALFDGERNIKYGTFYLQYLIGKYRSDLNLALAAYNAGETNVDNWQREGLKEIPFAETRQFVERVGHTKTMYDTIYGQWYIQK